MEIRKADSKGRVTGFEPGELYAFHRDAGHFYKIVAPTVTVDGAEALAAIRQFSADFQQHIGKVI